ncbi:MAG TPA: hypothetical protein VF331_09110 [Polyangiales bacterium]
MRVQRSGSRSAQRRCWLGLCLAVCSVAHAAPPAQPPAGTVAAHDSHPTPSQELFEIALDGWILLPGRYDVAVSADELAAGAGVGNELAVRALLLPGWVVGVQLMTLRRNSHSANLSDTRLSQLTLSVGPRLRVFPWLELRAQLAGGYDRLAFDDADALTDGIALSAWASLQLRLVEGLWVELGAGGFTQPIGGNGVTQLTVPATGFLSFGVCARLSQ